MGTTEQAIPPRPRKPPAPVLVSDRDEALQRMLAAIEDVHIGARLLGLPPQALKLTDRNGQASHLAAEELDVVARVDEQLAALEESALGPQPQRAAYISAPADPDAWLVRGFCRPGTMVLLAGPAGSSKSWAARQLAIEAATGQGQFMGTYDIGRPMRVLVLDEDNGGVEEYRREEVICAALGVERGALTNLYRLSLANVELDRPEWQRWLRGHLLRLEPDLVILDPISEMHGGKELREDPAFRSLLRFLKRLKTEFSRMATVAVHHTRKPSSGDRGPRTVDDVRGQWGQTPDVVAMMWRLPEQRVSWELFKRVPHSQLVLQATQAGPLVAVANVLTQRTRRQERDDKVLGYIEAGADSASLIVERGGGTRTTVDRAIASLLKAGLIRKVGGSLEVAEQLTDDPLPPEMEVHDDEAG